MRTRVKDFIEISDHTSLERLITTLVAIRDSLPESAEPELKMRGDDVFGRRLSISYFRELTPKEAELHDKYEGSAADPKLDSLTEQLGEVSYRQDEKRRHAA
jgi:hypothetical protein